LPNVPKFGGGIKSEGKKNSRKRAFRLKKTKIKSA